MKQCFKCKTVKPLNEFYKHKEMKDGHLGKCKECQKKDVKDRYRDPLSREKILAYERKRASDPLRKKMAYEYVKRMRARNPEKYKARQKVSNSIRNGSIKKGKCEMCGDPNTEAHHTDYSKPLEVMWLCRKHHMEIEGKTAY